MATKKIYGPKFYQELSTKEKELIYDGAMRLAAGCLSFETVVAGAPMMAGRLGVIQTMIPWFIRIATDTAQKAGLITTSRMSQEAIIEIDENISTTESEETDS
jgi:hypothetical protein